MCCLFVFGHSTRRSEAEAAGRPPGQLALLASHALLIVLYVSMPL
jgi:hypothetical protein